MPLTCLRQLVLVTVLGLACSITAQAKTPGEVEVGGLLPEASLRGLNGPDRRLANFRGKPLIINVWASWCPPCIAEMDSLERLAWSDGGQQFLVIGVSTDDDPDAAKAFLHRSQATLNHFIDGQLKLENMLGADHLPLTVLIDANGRVLHKVVGARDWASPQSIALVRQMFQLPQPASALRKR